MQILILAAGRGTRLGAKTQSIPKTLISIKGKPLLSFILDSLFPFKLSKIIIIGGYKISQLISYLDTREENICIVENPNYKQGSIVSLLYGESILDESFFLMNADHCYSVKILKQIFLLENNQCITAICDRDRQLMDDDMKVLYDDQGCLKKMDKKLTSYDAGYIGITYIPHSQKDIYWNTAHQVLEESGREGHVEMVLNKLVSIGQKIEILDVSGSTWIEVDNESDLKLAEDKIGMLG